MIRVFLMGFLLGVVLLVPPAGGGDEAEVSKASEEGPRLRFDDRVFSFGTVRAGEVLEHTFIFSNPGDQVLEITDIKTGCTCAVAGHYDAAVDPGKRGRIELTFDTTKLNKRISRVIRIYSNDSESPVSRLRLMGEVWQPFELRPAAAVIALADPVRSKKRVVLISSKLPRPVKLSHPTVDSERFRVFLKTVIEGKMYELTVETVPPLLNKSERAQVTIQTDHPEIPTLTVKAIANVTQAVFAVPTEIRFPAMVVAGTKRSAFIRHSKGKQFEVSDLFVSDKRLKVRVLKEQKRKRRLRYRVEVTAPAGYVVPVDGVTVTMKTNVPSVPTVSFAVGQISSNLGEKSRKPFRPQARPPVEDRD